MSLIEQAARRLEQLREAGSQLSGDLAFPERQENSPRTTDESSIIERAAQKLRALHGEPLPPVPEEVRVAVAAPDDGMIGANDTIPPEAVPAGLDLRDPPEQSIAVPPVPLTRPPVAEHEESVHDTPILSASRTQGRRRSREVEIDFNRIMERNLLTPNTAQSRLANELRVIKRPIINNCLGKGATPVKNARRIMVTSALPGEGKSFISMNLALSIAMERDSTVLLLEGDPTRPALAEMLGIPPARGLMDLLVDPKLDVSDVLIRTNLGRLSFIPAGTRQEHATELLASTVMEELVEQLYERYPDRILIFDSPPLLAAPEPRVLAQHMGQIVYVVEADQTSQSTVMEALATVESCPVVMAVLNKSSSREEGYYYSYYYSQPD